MNTFEIVIGILMFVAGGIATVLWALFNKQVSNMESNILDRKVQTEKLEEYVDEKFDKLESEMEEFRTNYLDRFDKVNTNINANAQTILDRIHALDLKIK